MTVLVLTRQLDPVADLVVHELNSRGTSLVRVDPGSLPASSLFTARLDGATGWTGEWRGQHRDLNLEEVTAVYWRRPSPHEMPIGMPPDVERWAQAEAKAGFGGVLSALSCTWVNHPHANAAATSGPRALAEAARCGLRVPRTMVTNDPCAARGFVASLLGGVAAYKAIGGGGPTTHEGTSYASWTSKVRAAEITDGVAATAHHFSEWIDKAYEVRLTVVTDQMFAAEIHTHSAAAREDFRRDYDACTYKVCEVPETVAHGVRALMGSFELRYAAMDFLVSYDGAWHLCDVNPNGQYGWIDELRAPITRAIADVLESP
ncbi:ATP-grasp ribosomal peptide maturase [Streptomyces iconiensis]|uniref:ATP-grasp ribosomal peptide maturase n=1 Tax=Streptomyces iconiensis TaxID=1384038 RepID=A0ABT6ZR07_9ACTN|nr:ATP-grasp ribosomal peptide maturase [Streptomyces iconiensis]MDJ1131229.1 ATP-grasp ribosomal peptide maturase [Streptomyces iconiensis]